VGRLSLALVVTVLAVGALVGGAPAGARPPTPPKAAKSRHALAALTVAVPGLLTGYLRKKFGG
jgi:hypothetical protein